jgi:hypothetical protein
VLLSRRSHRQSVRLPGFTDWNASEWTGGDAARDDPCDGSALPCGPESESEPKGKK